ncbi:MAG: hypothetical protein ACE5DO_14345, partial [Desulfobacterales bacterium]
MMKKFSGALKSVLIAVISISLVWILAGPGRAGDYKKEYKMTVVVSPAFYWGQGAIRFSELVKQKTNGQINIKPYWGSSLLKGAQ